MTTPATNNEQKPAFTTVEECRNWIAAAPLTHPVQAVAQLLRQLNLLNRTAIDANERFAMLEMLRKPLLAAQEAGARRFTGKPLPLVPPEQAAFDAAQALWQALMSGYVHCLGPAAEGGLDAQLATVIQRALTTLAAAQVDYYRAGYQPTASHWRATHELYAAAERAGIAGRPVEDSVRQGRTPSSPGAVYAEMLLFHVASPHELSGRHFNWVARWAKRWSAKVVISAAPPAKQASAVLCVDLASGDAAGYRPAEGETARWLDTGGVRRSLKKRLTLLEQGGQPGELQLGEDCIQPACGQVLKQVYQRWCKGGVPRNHERHACDDRWEVIHGVDAIYYYLAGRKPLRQPGRVDDETLRREREQLATFGRVAESPVEGFSEQQGYQIEGWRIIDESAAGIHIARPAGQMGGRVAPGQLVGIKPHDAQHFVLGSLRWTMMTTDQQLRAGVMIMPGRSEPVTARALDLTGTREPYRAAFLLPAIATLGAAASAVMPAGYFRPGRVLELNGARTARIRLLQLEDRGVDFDRATYEPAD